MPGLTNELVNFEVRRNYEFYIIYDIFAAVNPSGRSTPWIKIFKWHFGVA
jgi:hypothetical protein